MDKADYVRHIDILVMLGGMAVLFVWAATMHWYESRQKRRARAGYFRRVCRHK